MSHGAMENSGTATGGFQRQDLFGFDQQMDASGSELDFADDR
jgi:hypothetical protein